MKCQAVPDCADCHENSIRNARPECGLVGSCRVSHILPLFAVLLFCATESRGATGPETELRFEQDVRPILKAHCWHCHGEEAELKGGLDTRLVRLMMKGGDSGPAIVAGNHSDSLLYQKVASGEMPPADKKLSEAETDVLVRWLDAGAPTSRPEPEHLPPGETLMEEDRQHWSFQPVARPEIPAVRHAELVRSPVDAFLLSVLESQGLSFNVPADPATLVRRLYLDLTGLPPTPEVVERFVSSESGNAWELLVDEVLASPAYGERWGRHWLDVAGYADSDGYSEADPERKWAWKYRDYVIRSFNSDKPWNQFLTEQLAGDEMLAPPYQDLTPEQSDQLTATGFLRMAPDGTADSASEQMLARNDVMADTIRVVSTSLLGLSVGCAQCHEHRYDPVTQEDYYRLRAIFEPAYDWKNWRNPNARLVSLWSAETRTAAAAVDAELAEIAVKRTTELDSIVAETFERELTKLPASVQSLARQARETTADKRTDEQNQLIRQYPFLNVDRGSVYLYLPDRLTGFTKKWDELTEETRKKRPAEDLVMCLTEEPGKIPVTHLFSRGDFQQPRQEVAPGELTVLNTSGSSIPLDDPGLPTSGRRLAWARRLTSGDHPLLARVLVNRFWLQHFGRGLVGTPGDFGVKGERPSHPELLDWLARTFMEEGWSLKKFHRMILTSAAWRQSSVRRPEHDAIDPENRLIGRMSVRRLEAETVRDAMLAVSGQLTTQMYGEPVPVSPDDVGQIVLAIDTRDSAGRPSGKMIPLGDREFRRSIYVQVRRSMPLGVLEPFDLPTLTPNCEQRSSSTGPGQALMMLNNPFVQQNSKVIAQRVVKEAGSDTASQVQRAWQLILGKKATEAEVQQAVAFLADEIAAAEMAEEVTPQPSAPTEGAANPEAVPVEEKHSQAALSLLCHALLSSGGFLYAD